MLDLSVTELSAALAARKVSSVELTRAFLDRIGRLNGDLNAFITVEPERSLAQARAADARHLPAQRALSDAIFGGFARVVAERAATRRAAA